MKEILQWVTNASLDDGHYNDRPRLEIECVRSYPMPSDSISVEELEADGTYGLYRKTEIKGESPCPHCAQSHEIWKCLNKKTPMNRIDLRRIHHIHHEIVDLMKNNAPENEIQAKRDEREDILYGRKQK